MSRRSDEVTFLASSRKRISSTSGEHFRLWLLTILREKTTRTFKISGCLPSLPFLTPRAAPTYETQPFHGCRKRRRCSSGNKSRPGHRHSPGNGFRIQRTNRVRERSHPLGSGRSHPRLVGSLERHVPPPNAGAGATSSSSSAARPPVSYALREYRGHVPAFGFCHVCLAGAASWQAQRFASAGNPRRVGNRFGWYWHLRPRGCRTSPPPPKARFPASQQQIRAPSARTHPDQFRLT